MTIVRSELLTRAFYAWERHGRGGEEFLFQVRLEPPFRPFHLPVSSGEVDDARRKAPVLTWLERLMGAREAVPSVPEEPGEEEGFPESHSRQEPLRAFAVSLPLEGALPEAVISRWLVSLAAVEALVAFELEGSDGRVSLRLLAEESDARLVRQSLAAFLPQVGVRESSGNLCFSDEALAIELGLGTEFMLRLPLPRRGDPDSLTALLQVLREAGRDEHGLYQVLFEPASAPWGVAALNAVSDGRGGSFLGDFPDLPRLTSEKFGEAIFAVSVRLAATGSSESRSVELLRGLARAVALPGTWSENELVPLERREESDLFLDLRERQSHRTGMLLSLSELQALVHFPQIGRPIPGLTRDDRPSRPLVPELQGEGIAIGLVHHEDRVAELRISDAARLRHTHIVGATGTGKSTLLLRLILEDIARGSGVLVLDPHGDLVDALLARLPEERRDAVLLLDPASEDFATGFNLFTAKDDAAADLLASDLVAVFRRLSTSWGDQMSAVLGNAVQAILSSPRGGTLLDLRSFLIERDFRTDYLRSVRDSLVRDYFAHEYPSVKGQVTGSILARLDGFLRPRLVRRVVTRTPGVDFGEVIAKREVFLVKLAQGLIGEENASLLGSLLITSLHQAALMRQRIAPEERTPFFAYLDEGQNFATPSLVSLLSGARKFGVALTLVHQTLEQLRNRASDLHAALLGNAGIRLVFRTGEADARTLASGIEGFEALDLLTLEVGEAIGRVGRSDHSFRVEIPNIPPVIPELEAANREAVIGRTKERFPPRREDEGRELPTRPKPEQRTEVPVVSVPEVLEPEPVAQPRASSSGRGGEEHSRIVRLLADFARSRNWRALSEVALPTGGYADLLIEASTFRLAIEVSVTTAVAHELENAEKCLRAGFKEVVLVTEKEAMRERLGVELTKLSTPAGSSVSVVGVADLLRLLATREVPVEAETIRGYRVRVKYSAGDPLELEERITAVVARGLRRKRDE